MATYRIVAWKGIPSMVEAEDGEGAVSRQLSDRFQALIDAVAMQLGLEGAEAYLEPWSRSEPAERPGPAAAVAEAVAAELESRFAAFTGRAVERP